MLGWKWECSKKEAFQFSSLHGAQMENLEHLQPSCCDDGRQLKMDLVPERNIAQT